MNKCSRQTPVSAFRIVAAYRGTNQDGTAPSTDTPVAADSRLSQFSRSCRLSAGPDCRSAKPQRCFRGCAIGGSRKACHTDPSALSGNSPASAHPHAVVPTARRGNCQTSLRLFGALRRTGRICAAQWLITGLLHSQFPTLGICLADVVVEVQSCIDRVYPVDEVYQRIRCVLARELAGALFPACQQPGVLHRYSACTVVGIAAMTRASANDIWSMVFGGFVMMFSQDSEGFSLGCRICSPLSLGRKPESAFAGTWQCQGQGQHRSGPWEIRRGLAGISGGCRNFHSYARRLERTGAAYGRKLRVYRLSWSLQIDAVSNGVHYSCVDSGMADCAVTATDTVLAQKCHSVAVPAR